MKTAIIYDCEFLCLSDSPKRFWNGPQDPDPVIAQIGAVRLGLQGEYPLLDTYQVLVRPIDRFGVPYAVDPFFTELTGITPAALEQTGLLLSEALAGLDSFSNGATMWSWGKDELNMVAISCYVAGIVPPIPATRFDNAVKLVAAAGMPAEDIARTRSNTLADYYSVEHPPLRGHDALDDALSVAYAIQHLLRSGQIPQRALYSASGQL